MLSSASGLSARRFPLPEESSARDWTLFLQDMRRFCAKVSRYTEGLGQQQFLADELITAKQIPPDVRLRHPMVPWRRIAGLRDVLAHA